MKAPFFLLGFLSMLIAVSAFARIEEEQVSFEQTVGKVGPGMIFNFPPGFRLEPETAFTVTKPIRSSAYHGSCYASMASSVPVRIAHARDWKVTRSYTQEASHTIELSAMVEGQAREMKIVCSGPNVSLNLLRYFDIAVPTTKPVKVDLIHDDAPDYEHVRDENATIAI